MSTAEDAWQEWEAEHYGARGANAETQRLFKSAYRRALEDAAKVIQVDAGPLAKQAVGGEFIVECAVKAYRNGLLEMAAGVGTKDGDDEIEVPCLSCNDDPNVDCPVGCGRR